jgi:hypothetical protein
MSRVALQPGGARKIRLEVAGTGVRAIGTDCRICRQGCQTNEKNRQSLHESRAANVIHKIMSFTKYSLANRKRRGGDSNPREACTPTSFRD